MKCVFGISSWAYFFPHSTKMKMLSMRKITVIIVSLVFTHFLFAQHPNRKKIYSLEKILPSTQGTNRIDCLNALSEEYWWPPRVYPDPISMRAKPAHDEALNINYSLGLAITNTRIIFTKMTALKFGLLLMHPLI